MRWKFSLSKWRAVDKSWCLTSCNKTHHTCQRVLLQLPQIIWHRLRLLQIPTTIATTAITIQKCQWIMEDVSTSMPPQQCPLCKIAFTATSSSSPKKQASKPVCCICILSFSTGSPSIVPPYSNPKSFPQRKGLGSSWDLLQCNTFFFWCLLILFFILMLIFYFKQWVSMGWGKSERKKKMWRVCVLCPLMCKSLLTSVGERG